MELTSGVGGSALCVLGGLGGRGDWTSCVTSCTTAPKEVSRNRSLSNVIWLRSDKEWLCGGADALDDVVGLLSSFVCIVTAGFVIVVVICANAISVWQGAVLSWHDELLVTGREECA